MRRRIEDCRGRLRRFHRATLHASERCERTEANGDQSLSERTIDDALDHIARGEPSDAEAEMVGGGRV